MVRRRDVVKIDVTPHLSLIRANARLAELGCTSHVRGREDRIPRLAEDQFVGQVGECALSVWLTGSADAYRRSRERANADPYVGDDGSDLPGSRIDVKTSRWRTRLLLLSHHLLVREAERHEGTTYVLALARIDDQAATCHLVGWTRDLPEQPSQDHRFAGAYAVPGRALAPMFLLETG